jgi:hypothetical protein
MRFKAGDRIEVTINTLGVAPRRGAVLESTSAGGIHVQWDDGHQSVFMPGSNCQLAAASGDVVSHPVRLGCHIDVTIVEDDRECRAIAKVTTNRGFFEGEGIARLKPGDPQIPRIGEELALGRALRALSEQLLSVAAEEIAERPAGQPHLVG